MGTNRVRYFREKAGLSVRELAQRINLHVAWVLQVEKAESAWGRTPWGEVHRDVEPSYLALFRSGELAARVKEAYARLASCDLCPRHCGVNRLAGEKGACHKGADLQISHYSVLIRTEEPFLVGKHGTAEVAFSGCHLGCVYCIFGSFNFFGKRISPKELAEDMLNFQKRGARSCMGVAPSCHNLQLLSPTHFIPQILEALEIAVSRGFRLPLVYNTSGYETIDTLRLLEGIIDIYLPDLKYSDPEAAMKYSGVEDYPRITQEAIREMHRQVGDLVLDEQGVAVRGLHVRHLVLPGGLAGTEECMKFLASLSPKITVWIMSEYWPYNIAYAHPPLNRRIAQREWEEAIEAARRHGIDVDLSLKMYRARRLEMELLGQCYFHDEFCQEWGDANYAKVGSWQLVGKKGVDKTWLKTRL